MKKTSFLILYIKYYRADNLKGGSGITIFIYI